MIVFSILFPKHFMTYRFVPQTPGSIRKSQTGSNSKKRLMTISMTYLKTKTILMMVNINSFERKKIFSCLPVSDYQIIQDVQFYHKQQRRSSNSSSNRNKTSGKNIFYLILGLIDKKVGFIHLN